MAWIAEVRLYNHVSAQRCDILLSIKLNSSKQQKIAPVYLHIENTLMREITKRWDISTCSIAKKALDHNAKTQSISGAITQWSTIM